MLLFRLVIHVAPSIAAMRLFGAFYSAASAILLAIVGTQLYGATAGLCADLLYAVFATGPHIEGFIVNGELLSTLPTVAAMACLLLAQRSRRARLYLLLAGVCAGMAPLVKQSSIDGIAAVVLFAPLGRDVHGRAAGPAGRGVMRRGDPPAALRPAWRPDRVAGLH